jgi:hypothetical protein
VEDGCIVDAEGFLVVMVGPDDDALFSHIVRCVNAHDGLVEALEDAIAGMHYIEQGHGRLYGVGWDRVYDKARAALAAAKEGAATDGPDEAMEEKAADFRRDMEEEIYGDL